MLDTPGNHWNGFEKMPTDFGSRGVSDTLDMKRYEYNDSAFRLGEEVMR